MCYIIQRSLPGRKFKYALAMNDTDVEWRDSPMEASLFASIEACDTHITSNRKTYGHDDRAILAESYNGHNCPACVTGMARRDYTEAENLVVRLAMSCTYCNHKWIDQYNHEGMKSRP